MAKCKRCGKKGFFLKVNQNLFCKDCERIDSLLKEEQKIRENIDLLKQSYAENVTSLMDIKANRDELYNQIAEQARQDSLHAIQSEIEEKQMEYDSCIQKLSYKNAELDNTLIKLNDAQKGIESDANKLLKIKTLLKSIQYSIKRYYEYFDDNSQKEVIDNSLVEYADELLATTVKLKLNSMDIRELRKRYKLNDKLINDLLIRYQSRYTTKTNMSIYRLMVIALEAELQNVMYNMKYGKLDKSIEAIKAMVAKYEKIATDGSQTIAGTMVKFIGELEYLYIEAVKIEYEYYVQKERIKEEQKTLREQMRQEAAERKALEAEQKKIDQEEKKYQNEISIIQQQMLETSNIEKIGQLQDRMEKVLLHLSEVEQKKDDIAKLQNGKAGYIYIISNLGSFGDNVFKVGMTRRLDPQERIDELGGASVPFQFDVHSFIFSENAPELELNMHKQLHKKRINKINLRKEFFNTSIDELENIVYSLEPSAAFNRTMLADQYYKSLSVDEIPDEVVVPDETEDMSEAFDLVDVNE